MEKLSPNPAQLFVRNKYTVFTMGGNCSSPVCQQKFFRRATVLQLRIICKAYFASLQFTQVTVWSNWPLID